MLLPRSSRRMLGIPDFVSPTSPALSAAQSAALSPYERSLRGLPGRAPSLPDPPAPRGGTPVANHMVRRAFTPPTNPTSLPTSPISMRSLLSPPAATSREVSATSPMTGPPHIPSFLPQAPRLASPKPASSAKPARPPTVAQQGPPTKAVAAGLDRKDRIKAASASRSSRPRDPSMLYTADGRVARRRKRSIF